MVPEKGEDGGTIRVSLGRGIGDGGGVGAVFRQFFDLGLDGIVGLLIGGRELAVERLAGGGGVAGCLRGRNHQQAAQHTTDEQQAETAFQGGELGHKNSFQHMWGYF